MSDLTSSPLGSLDYDPAPESKTVAQLRESYGLFIDGEFTDPSRHESFLTLNPATEEPLANVAQASSEDVDRAVAAARRAYDTVWKKTTGAERAKYLFRIARLIQERSRELAVVETLDNGKASREILTSRSRRPTSSTTPAGRTSSTTRASVRILSRSASRARSFRGTFHC